jgi:ATP-dependent RNA helicase DDX56/DBP9
LLVLQKRCHVVNEFNRGIYDYIIATDEVGVSRVAETGAGKTKSRKRKRDKEYGVARGIDFQGLVLLCMLM